MEGWWKWEKISLIDVSYQIFYSLTRFQNQMLFQLDASSVNQIYTNHTSIEKSTNSMLIVTNTKPPRSTNKEIDLLLQKYHLIISSRQWKLTEILMTIIEKIFLIVWCLFSWAHWLFLMLPASAKLLPWYMLIFYVLALSYRHSCEW